MKDAIHHLKHVQKKVIQSVRKLEEKPTIQNSQGNANLEKAPKRVASS